MRKLYENNNFLKKLYFRRNIINFEKIKIKTIKKNLNAH